MAKYKLNPDKLQALMSKRHVSVAKLASLSGVTNQCVKHYLNGRNQPTGPVLLAMCEVLRTNPYWLMEKR